MNKQDKPVSNHIWRVGDTARVVGNRNSHQSHQFKIGEIVRLMERSVETWRAEYLDGRGFWFVDERDIEPLEQVKPLRDWTLGEVHALCERQATCGACPLGQTEGHDCTMVENAYPSGWDLTDPRSFPAAELEAMRLLHAAGAETIAREDDGLLSWHGGLTQGLLPHRLFPSIRAGQSVVLGEIVGE